MLRVGAESVLDLSRYLDTLPDVTRRAARLAINDTMQRQAMPLIRQKIKADAAFPPGYLDDPKRLGIEQYATEAKLEGAIMARQRPTSLARFAIGSPAPGARGGVQIAVKPGGGRTLDRAFLLRLRSGAELNDDAFNLGLAVRLRPGETLTGKRIQTKRGPSGLTLLYGPSVDQLFRQISNEVSPALAEGMASQFLRQFVRLSSGG
jgi:hypothetical protein